MISAISSPLNRFQPRALVRYGLALLSIVLLTQRVGAAQGITYDPEWVKEKFTVESMLRNGNVTEEAKFKGYFNFYILPPLAKVGPKDQKNFDLPQIRQDLKRSFVRATGNAHDQLNQLVRDFIMEKAVRVRDPACRINSVLVLGDLNETEQAGNRPAKPWPTALKDLVSLLKMPKLPDYMRVPAMVGVQRHASMKVVYPLDPVSEAEITQQMLALLKENKVPESREASGHYYMRGLAAEILGLLGNPGKNGEIVLAIKAAIDDAEAPILFRVGLCSMIGMFDYTNSNVKIDFPALAASVCYAVLDATQKEFERVEKLMRESNEYIDPERRKLAYFFRQAYYAFNGVNATLRRSGRSGIAGALANKPEAKPVQAMQASIMKVIKHLEENEIPNGEKLKPMAEELKVALPQRAEAGKIPVGVAGASDKSPAKN